MYHYAIILGACATVSWKKSCRIFLFWNIDILVTGTKTCLDQFDFMI